MKEDKKTMEHQKKETEHLTTGPTPSPSALARAPQKMSEKYYALAYMAASGAKHKDIGTELGMSRERVRQILASSEVRLVVEKIRFKIYGQDSKKRFQNILPKAITTAEEIMENERVKPSIRADVAFRFMDRALGKAVQPIEHGGSFLRDLILAMRPPEEKVLDVTPGDQSKIEGASAHPGNDEEHEQIDNWIEKTYGEKK